MTAVLSSTNQDIFLDDHNEFIELSSLLGEIFPEDHYRAGNIYSDMALSIASPCEIEKSHMVSPTSSVGAMAAVDIPTLSLSELPPAEAARVSPTPSSVDLHTWKIGEISTPIETLSAPIERSPATSTKQALVEVEASGSKKRRLSEIEISSVVHPAVKQKVKRR
jgi:hypothetical protein